MNVQDKILEIKLIKEALERRECEEFEMALRHKSKLCVYKELKRGVEFEEYLKYVKGPPSRLFLLNSVRVPMGFLKNWVGMLRGVGLRNVLILGLVRSLSSMFFLSVHHTIHKEKFLDYMKQVLTLEAFETFTHGSIFDKAVFCLSEKQGMLLNDECNSWYNKVGDFSMSVWDRRKEILYANGSLGEVSQNNPTPKCEVNGTECYEG